MTSENDYVKTIVNMDGVVVDGGGNPAVIVAVGAAVAVAAAGAGVYKLFSSMCGDDEQKQIPARTRRKR